MSTVSVHIVTYNSEQWIRQCLDAVFNQSHPIEQVIVIDNDSKDSTVRVLEELIPQYDERLIVVKNMENRGFAGGHNQAMKMSTSDYYLVLNPDVTLHEDYVAYLVGYLDEHPHIGSGTGKLIRQSSEGIIDSTGLVMHKNRRCFDRGANEPEAEWNQREEVFGVSGAAAVYSKRMVDDISIDGQFFDEQFFAYKEDVDVAWRGQLLGWGAIYIPEAQAYHERGWKEGERHQRPLFVRKHSYINRYRMMMKNDSPRYICKHLLPILLFEGASLAYHVLREPQVLSAWRDLWRDRSRLKAHRREIQRKRKMEIQDVYAFFV